MSNVAAVRERLGSLASRPVPWLTVILLAVVLAGATSFWVTAVRGAVGAIERTQSPFASWWHDSALMLPLFVIAVLVVLSRAHVRFGPLLRTPKTVVATALAIVAVGTAVGLGAFVVSAVYDYHLQTALLKKSLHVHAVAIPFGQPEVASPGHDHGAATEAAAIQQRHDTLNASVRGVEFGGSALLVTNLLLVGWVVALRGGQLDAAGKRRSSRARQAATAPAVAGRPAVAIAESRTPA